MFGGNQLAVVLDGRGLSSATMQAIAKEMNFSETTFVLPPERPDTDARVRIFTPAEELPMAGHPTIGTTYALARAGIVAPPVDSLTLGLGIGPTPVSLEWKGEALSFVWMTQQRPTFGEPAADRAAAAAALRLPAASVTDTGLPVQVVSCGVPYPLRSAHHAPRGRQRRPRRRRVRRRSAAPPGSTTCQSSCSRPSQAPITALCTAACSRPAPASWRIPPPAAPAGRSVVIFCDNKVVTPERAGAMLIVQGVKMGRPSYIHVAIGVDARRDLDVRVGGESVVVGEGTLYSVMRAGCSAGLQARLES